MDWLKLLPLAVLLPLFPASMLFNWVERRLEAPWAKAALMLVWAQAGIGVLLWLAPEVPAFVSVWAVGTALFYAVRALVLNEATAWTAFMFVSLLSLSWLLPIGQLGLGQAQLYMLLAILPLLLLNLLSSMMIARFGSAYLGLVGGLVHRYPRLSTLIALSVLAAMATPPFPLFFYLIELISVLSLGLSIGVLTVWYLWGWAGVRLLQRLVLGPDVCRDPKVSDLSRGVTWGMVAIYVFLGLFGLWEAFEMVEVG